MSGLGSTLPPEGNVTVQVPDTTSVTGKKIVIPVSPFGMTTFPFIWTFRSPIGWHNAVAVFISVRGRASIIVDGAPVMIETLGEKNPLLNTLLVGVGGKRLEDPLLNTPLVDGANVEMF
jgi:hypothetical protein